MTAQPQVRPLASAPQPRQIVMLGCDPTAPGGISAVLRTLLESRLAQEWPVRMISTWRAGSVLQRTTVAAQAAGALWLMLLQGRVQAVHAHVAGRGSFWRKALLLLPVLALRVPVVLHVHDGTFVSWYGSQGMVQRWLIRSLLHKADAVVVLSESWQGALQELAPRGRFHVIHNPVRLPAPPPTEGPHSSDRHTTHRHTTHHHFPHRRIVLFLSRLWREKGLDELLQAAAILQATHPDVRWLLAGDGDLRAVRKRAQALRIDHAVRIVGWVDGAAKTALLRQADVLALPSWAEGQPVAVIEAMACGVPVVATAVGGLPDLLAEGGGLLVPPRNPRALATALASLLDEPQRRLQLGQEGQSLAKRRHEAGVIAAQVGQLYRSLALHRSS